MATAGKAAVRLGVVAPHEKSAETRATVRSAQATGWRPTVLAVCACYMPVADEIVLGLGELGMPISALNRAATTLEPVDWYRWVLAALLARLAADDQAVVAVPAGMEILGPAPAAGTLLGERSLVLVARTGRLQDILAGRAAATPSDSLHEADLVVVGGVDAATTTLTWLPLAADWRVGERSVDMLSALVAHRAIQATELVLSAATLPAGADVVLGGGRLLVDGQPVPMLDLSKADRETPWLLDATDSHPRVLLSRHEALAGEVARRLAARRIDSTGPSGPAHAAPYSTVSTGARLDPALRELFRAGDPPDPFEPSGAERLRAWLTAPAEGEDARGASRYLRAIWAIRPDLRAAFPRIPGRDTPALRAWAARHAADEGFDPALLPRPEPVSAPAPRRPRAPLPDRALPGVNVVGYLSGELGIGESARLVTTALEAAGVRVSVEATALDLTSPQRAKSSPRGGLDFDTTLLCVNAAEVGRVVAAYGPDLPKGQRIGYWYWEVETFPVSYHGAFGHVDEVWVATDFVREAIAPHSPVPVLTMTPPLWTEPALPVLGRRELGLPQDRPVVLFSFDYLSTAERKNPWGAVEAFRRAFPETGGPSTRPVLVVKSINAERRRREAERLRMCVGEDPDVLLFEEYLSPEARSALTGACDVYLSLHRSEGLGLTMVEAMCRGKPVVATGYSGNLQFMDEDTAFLVPWRPVPVPAGCEPYPKGSVWADPDLDEAARLLRSAIDDPVAARRVGLRGAQLLQTRHTPAVAGAAMRARLKAMRPSLVGRLRRHR